MRSIFVVVSGMQLGVAYRHMRSIARQKWKAIKEAWLEATEQVCGWTKRPLRHHVAWWWNKEAAKAVEKKRRRFKM